MVGFPAVSWHLTYLVYACPSANPETVVECDAAPVVEKVFGIEAYVGSDIDHLHVAASLVVALNVTCVVPDENTWFGVGAVIETVGGVESTATLKFMI